MYTNMQFTINSFRQLFTDKIFSLTTPWHFPDFSKIPDISLTDVKFPDISRFYRQVVTLRTALGKQEIRSVEGGHLSHCQNSVKNASRAKLHKTDDFSLRYGTCLPSWVCKIWSLCYETSIAILWCIPMQNIYRNCTIGCKVMVKTMFDLVAFCDLQFLKFSYLITWLPPGSKCATMYQI